jgi:nicotinamide-nucleotide amidase
MLAEIITIGDEILIGQIVDTNSAWLGQELSALGIQVKQITSCSDNREHILMALKEASHRANLIIITGGLGPTKDDITKKTLTEYFNAGTVVHEPTLDRVKAIFKMRNMPMLESNMLQASVPDNCTVVFNTSGTAPGMWFYENDIAYISMPGVPFEMKTMFTEGAIPLIKKTFELPVIVHRTLLTVGIGESFLAEKIKTVEESLPPHIKLAYLPSLAQVRLRLSGHGHHRQPLMDEINIYAEKMRLQAPDYFFGEEDETMEGLIGKLLTQRKETLSAAESCTGGLLAHSITTIPGSSEYFSASIVTYSYEAKMKELGVNLETLEKHGAVSEQTVIEMAEGCRKKFNTTYAVSISGIAGPGGGTTDKPVGTVWMAVATPDRVVAKLYHMGDDRVRTQTRSAILGMELLRRVILNIV